MKRNRLDPISRSQLFIAILRLPHKTVIGKSKFYRTTIESYENFDIAKFVFPIPADEINADACTQQNEGWNNYLPK